MGDVLPLKRQAVVERLRRRFDGYRKHQDICLPRYDQTANGLYESQRQETALLKQRFLESKAKKAKTKSDHHRTYKEPSADTSKTQPHPKPLKRPADDGLPNPPESVSSEDSEKPAKMARVEDKPLLSDLQAPPPLSQPPQQRQQQQQNLNPFAVQFSQSPLGPANPVPSLDPLPSPSTQVGDSTAGREDVGGPIGGLVECKQERDSCDSSDLYQYRGDANQPSVANSVSSGGDRFSDSFSNIELPDDAGETLNQEILEGLIADMFTNPTDLMTFNFEDSVGSVKDSEDATKDIIGDLMKSASPGPALKHFHPEFSNAPGHQQQQQHPAGMVYRNAPTTPDTPISSSSPTFYGAQRLPPYGASSLLDFKLTEPSPAALTLKQMAEQHQNMQVGMFQQKQLQQLANPTLTNRQQQNFNPNAYSGPVNSLRPANSYLSNPDPVRNDSKMGGNGAPSPNDFDPFDPQRPGGFLAAADRNSFPAGSTCDPVRGPAANNVLVPPDQMRARAAANTAKEAEVFRVLQMKLAQQRSMEQQKPPPYEQQLGQFSDCPPLRQQQQSPTLMLRQQQQSPTLVVRQQQQSPTLMVRQQQQSPTLMVRQQQQSPTLMVRQQQQSPTLVVRQQQQSPTLVVRQQQQRNAGPPFPGVIQVQQMQPRHHAPQQQQQQASQLDQGDLKQQQQRHAAVVQQQQQQLNTAYASFPARQQQQQQQVIDSNPGFRVSQFSPRFAAPSGRPPPEYKATPRHHSPIPEPLGAPFDRSAVPKSRFTLPKQQQRAPNVTIAAREWTAPPALHSGSFRPGRPFEVQDGFGDSGGAAPPFQNVPLSPVYNQYGMAPMTMHQRPTLQQRPRIQTEQQQPQQQQHHHQQQQQHPLVIDTGNSLDPMFPEQDLNRQDAGHLNFDFLDNIESSASDLLNFDHVMHGHAQFPILDDMDILGK